MKGKHRGERTQEEIEERVISIISSLFGENSIQSVRVFFHTLAACQDTVKLVEYTCGDK